MFPISMLHEFKLAHFHEKIALGDGSGLTNAQLMLTNDDLLSITAASGVRGISLVTGSRIVLTSWTTWMIASVMMVNGLSWWQSWICVWVGNIAVGVFVCLTARVGAVYHISFPVASRAAFGIWGSLWPVFNRAGMACIWYGVQLWIGGQCVTLMLRSIWPGYKDLPNNLPVSSGTNTRDFAAFLIFALLSLPALWFPVEKIRHLFTVKAYTSLIAAVGLLVWSVRRAGGIGPTMSRGATIHGSQLGWTIVKGIMASIASFATMIVNAPDFSRMARKPKDALWSQLLTIPLGFGLTAFAGVIVASSSEVQYSKPIWNPLDVLGRYLDDANSAGRFGVFVIAFAFAIATLGTNVAANSISAGTSLSAILPRYINIRRGSYICAAIGFVICPWHLMSNSNNFITYLSSYSVFLSSVVGVTICDYYVVRKGYIETDALYKADKAGPYYHTYGISWHAYTAYLAGILVNIVGFAGTVGAHVPQVFRDHFKMATERKSSNALPQTLLSITTTKASDLSKQYALFKSQKESINRNVASQRSPEGRVQALLEGVTRVKGFPEDGIHLSNEEHEDEKPKRLRFFQKHRGWYRNIRRLLLQRKYDAAITDEMLSQWEADLQRDLEIMTRQYEHAQFFYKLVDEWLENPNESLDIDTDENGELNPEGSFQPVGREEMYEQRVKWEALVFEPRNTNGAAIESYLETLFNHSSLSGEALDTLRKSIKETAATMLTSTVAFDAGDLPKLLNGLVRNGRLSPEKVAMINEIKESATLRLELQNILRGRLAQLSSWNWTDGVVPVDMQRQLNGKYRVYMDEDILDAILLHHVGLEWGETFKLAFQEMFRACARKSKHMAVPKHHQNRRHYYLGELTRGTSPIETKRREVFEEQYFMAHLPTSQPDKTSWSDYDCDDKAEKSGRISLKQSLLNLFVTETHLQTALYGQITAVQSDFKWFGPSLSHTTLLTVLKFFGMPQMWLDFFMRYLETPLKFPEDGPHSPVRVRKNGAPISSSITDLLGEAMLFCLDYAVNQHADGAYLYRQHDDFWFWGSTEICVQAWKTIGEFSAVMGLDINEEKTGSATIRGKKLFGQDQGLSSNDELGVETDNNLLDKLPTGPIRWGFLVLDEKSGRFVVDKKQVEKHTLELKHQLSSCKSIFRWIKAWNTYLVRFFSNNLAQPAICLGRQHIDMVLETYQQVEQQLFDPSSAESSPVTVTSYLRKEIETRFGVRDLPDGIFYFPPKMGGLELKNHFIPYLLKRESITRTPDQLFQQLKLNMERKYVDAKEKFEREGPDEVVAAKYSQLDGFDPDNFMSLAEYTRCVGSTLNLLNVYEKLLSLPDEVDMDPVTEIDTVLEKHDLEDPYWTRITQMYLAEMKKEFGDIRAAEYSLLPMGVIDALAQGKVRWKG
ncbi:hypothetical protein FQN57_004059 [Myotisia sp. PD_48]|nr:hypothetical protein FQN57_004059 [Myotisia sp. PD_48]